MNLRLHFQLIMSTRFIENSRDRILNIPDQRFMGAMVERCVVSLAQGKVASNAVLPTLLAILYLDMAM